MIKGIEVSKDCSNLSTLPNLTWTIDSIDYTLTPSEYVLEVDQMGESQCVMAVMGSDFGTDFPYFILGDSFMRKFYSFFDKNNSRVGFIDTTKLATQ